MPGLPGIGVVGIVGDIGATRGNSVGFVGGEWRRVALLRTHCVPSPAGVGPGGWWAAHVGGWLHRLPHRACPSRVEAPGSRVGLPITQ